LFPAFSITSMGAPTGGDVSAGTSATGSVDGSSTTAPVPSSRPVWASTVSGSAAGDVTTGSASPVVSVPYVDVCAPPELLTFISGTPLLAAAPASESDDDADDSSAPVDVVTFADDSVVAEAGADGAAGPAPEGPDAAGESTSDSASAWATPGVVATAIPTPSDTARAPTRPMYLA
jgi:hypothetical protein